jgi:hypothetical protein
MGLGRGWLLPCAPKHGTNQARGPGLAGNDGLELSRKPRCVPISDLPASGLAQAPENSLLSVNWETYEMDRSFFPKAGELSDPSRQADLKSI